jgi:hypothetical protein
MKNFLILLSFLFVFTTNVFSQCTINTHGEYGNFSTTCGTGSFGAWSSITNCYDREYSIVNVVSGNTYEFQAYRTSNLADRYATITTTANVAIVWGNTSTTTSISWTATFTGQVRFWSHLSSTNCGPNNNNTNLVTRRVRCNDEPPQNIVPSSGSNSYTLCSGVLYDNGGSGGNYANNSNGFAVINPATPGSMVELTGSIDTEFNYDFVRIYDGNSTGGTLLWQGSGVQNIGTITSTLGPLTVQFTSDFLVNYSGFALNIDCIVPSPPSCATTPTPTNGSTSISLAQQLSWPAVSGATGYDVYFGTTNPVNTLVSSNQAGTTYNPGTLNPNTTYYWRVVPRNSVGSATGCSTWSFTTIAPGPCINTFSKMVLVIEPTNIYADEVGYTLFNSSNVTIQSGNGFPDNVTSFINLSGQPQPYTLDIETQGTFGDNSINYYVFCGIALITSGSLNGGENVSLSNLQCNFNMPTQSTPSVLSACPDYGLFTDEYTEWTGGIAGTDYIVNSSVSTDWITVTSTTPNGTVIAFGSSPLIWTAPNNGTYYIHVSTDGFCGEDFDCRDITVERLSALPVTLISFTMECDKGIPLIKWTTESEQNSDYFQIERSRDGFEWIEVSKVQAYGYSNTTKEYKFYDLNSGSFEGYYRLKQVDFDGKFEIFSPIYSNCIEVKGTEYDIFPNPTKDEFFIGIRSDINEKVNVSITDFSGKIIKETSVEIKKGYTLEKFDLSQYPTGIYLITIISNNNKYIHKVIKK